ncbi:VanZ family protein [Actinoplanes sp. NPDC051851]|uniref:VanZ family protein n=1 Tax=Actinoplanes sp. NPDC051851 TaxID=3154753 RepID=UPI0034154C6E
MSHPTTVSAPPRRLLLLGAVLFCTSFLLYEFRGMFLMAAPACMAGRWHGCYDTENGVVLMTLVWLPVAGLVAWGLASVRRAGGGAAAWRMSIAEVGMVYGTAPWLWLTMMPGPGAGIVPGRLSLIPLADLVGMGWLGIGGNLLVLAALGFFGPIRFAALASVPRILALGVGCSALIETAQYVLQLDRVSSIDDVLVNATGTVLAGLASRRWWRR